jgi:hypothetical protein
MDETLLTTLEQPRFEQRKVLLIAGLGERYNVGSSKGIPALWQRFIPHIGNIPGQLGPVAYGVLCNFDDDGNFDYIASVDVSNFRNCPPSSAACAFRNSAMPYSPTATTYRRSGGRCTPSTANGCRNPACKPPTGRPSSAMTSGSILRRAPAAWKSGYLLRRDAE